MQINAQIKSLAGSFPSEVLRGLYSPPLPLRLRGASSPHHPAAKDATASKMISQPELALQPKSHLTFHVLIHRMHRTVAAPHADAMIANCFPGQPAKMPKEKTMTGKSQYVDFANCSHWRWNPQRSSRTPAVTPEARATIPRITLPSVVSIATPSIEALRCIVAS